MWAMKDFVFDNVSTSNIEQKNAAVNQKKIPFECSLVDMNKHNSFEHEKLIGVQTNHDVEYFGGPAAPTHRFSYN